ncbi:sensor histidine kinase [Enterococcus sp. JM9B]|uniref:sensor histidine kinase n=1 Tax=Enterococcus sp. JM9B TaxID=1857216 RepID=UPI001374CBE4|nr:histidine kinase [Enterococcus sp. JM9B]KAF1301878.1 hypothetical protein BAU16_08315 [Enterococcus sp. JM9B]
MKTVKNLSKLKFREKLQFAIFSVVFIFVVCLFFISFIWRNALTEQIYQNVYSQMVINSQTLNTNFKRIEQLSYQAIDDAEIQDYLLTANSEIKNNQEHAVVKQLLSNKVNQLIRNTSMITNAFLLDTKKNNLVNFITDGENILSNLSVDDIVNSIPDQPSKGEWFFPGGSTQSVYARKIFSTKGPSLEYLGTIIFIVNNSFIENIVKSNLNYSAESLFLLTYKDQEFYFDKNQSALFQQLKNSFSVETSKFTNFSYKKRAYYTTITKYDDLVFTYLIPNKMVLKQITQIQLLLFIFLGLLVLLMIYAIWKITTQLTRPITELSVKMKQIEINKNIEDLTEITTPTNQGDEIATLYASYNSMINEINQLIEDNYKIKILSQEIEFVALQSQLDPHFLYNTLDSINWLAVENNQTEISKMVTSLALLFRKKINTPNPETTLKEELELIDAYVTIQKIRFETRVIFLREIQINDLSKSVPKFIIQPLIENSFKYAVERMDEPCLITLRIQQINENIVISVADNGPGFSNDDLTNPSSGIGIKNIKERLALFYMDRASLTIQSEPYKQTIVSITIPVS